MLLVDFDPIRRLQSLIIFKRNTSLNPVNDLKSLFSNRLFGFKFDRSKIDIANDLPTFTQKNKTNLIFLFVIFYIEMFYLFKNSWSKFWRNKTLNWTSLRNKMYHGWNKINKSASIIVTF